MNCRKNEVYIPAKCVKATSTEGKRQAKKDEKESKQSDCPKGKIRNPLSGYCVDINGRIGKKIIEEMNTGREKGKTNSRKSKQKQEDEPKNKFIQNKCYPPQVQYTFEELKSFAEIMGLGNHIKGVSDLRKLCAIIIQEGFGHPAYIRFNTEWAGWKWQREEYEEQRRNRDQRRRYQRQQQPFNRSECPEDFYSLLEIKHNATSDEIGKAYRRTALKNHPDKGGDVEFFKRIVAAYETLTDDTKRKIYDACRYELNR